MSRRTERVGHLIRSIVAQTIQSRLADPRIPAITSITRVEVADDFSVARIHVSVMAPEAQRALCLTALRSAAGLLRRALAPELRLRKIPALVFQLDDSLRQSAATVDMIDQAMRELGQAPEWEREEQDTDVPVDPETTAAEGACADQPPGAPDPSRASPSIGGGPEDEGVGQEGA